MVTHLRIRRAVILLMLYVSAALIVIFFTYSAYHGNRGIMAKRDYKIKIANLQQNLNNLKKEQMNWQVRVNLVKSTALDPDILEERSRLILNSSHRNDVIVLFDSFK
jgi:cell division protein FtsB